MHFIIVQVLHVIGKLEKEESLEFISRLCIQANQILLLKIWRKMQHGP